MKTVNWLLERSGTNCQFTFCRDGFRTLCSACCGGTSTCTCTCSMQFLTCQTGKHTACTETKQSGKLKKLRLMQINDNSITQYAVNV